MTAIPKKKSAPTKRAPTKTAAKKTTPTSKASNKKTSNIDTTQRHNMIAEAAYYIAEKNGFEGSSMHDDWLAAEQEIGATWPKAK